MHHKKNKFLKKTVAFVLAAILSLNISSLAFAAEGGTDGQADGSPSSLTVKVVDESGAPVEGVELYMDSTEYGERADSPFESATDAEGKAVYNCTGNEMEDDYFEILPTEDSGYTCDTPVEVTFGIDFSTMDTYIATVDGEPYTGGEVQIVVKGGGQPDVPDQYQRTLNVKVVDEEGAPVEGVPLFMGWNGSNNGLSFVNVTDAEGKASYECGTALEFDGDTYELIPAENSGYICDTPAEIVFDLDDNFDSYVSTVNGEAYAGEEVVLIVKESTEEPEQYQRTLNVKVIDEEGAPVEGVALYMVPEGYEGYYSNLDFDYLTDAEGKASYNCSWESTGVTYLLMPTEDSNYTCDTPVEVTFEVDDYWTSYVATVNGAAYAGEDVQLVVKTEGGEEPSEPTEYQRTLNVKAVDEAGSPVEGVSFYLKSTEYGQYGDCDFEALTDADGKVAYECSNLEMSDDVYLLMPAEDSGYTCDTPIEVEFGEDEEFHTYVATVGGQAYDGGEIEIVVTQTGSEPSEPTEYQRTLNVKVVDEDGNPVEGVELYLESQLYAPQGNREFENATDADGKAVYECSIYEMDDDEYLLKPVEDSSYTCDTPAVITFATDEDWNNYVATVNGEAYTGEEITIVVKDSATEEPDPELPYTDVSDADWFYNEVTYAYEKGIMTGINDTTFAPYESLARAQFAIILHRLNGEPQMEYTDRFHDVGEGLWYTDAILWAADTDVVTGYSNGNFGPADKINREQMATMMYRYAEYKGYSLEGGVDYSQYKDAANVSDFAKEAMSWAVGNGVITGKYDETQLDPQGEASRAECAIIMMRFIETFGE